jgi:hypothetical protein
MSSLHRPAPCEVAARRVNVVPAPSPRVFRPSRPAVCTLGFPRRARPRGKGSPLRDEVSSGISGHVGLDRKWCVHRRRTVSHRGPERHPHPTPAQARSPRRQDQQARHPTMVSRPRSGPRHRCPRRPRRTGLSHSAARRNGATQHPSRREQRWPRPASAPLAWAERRPVNATTRTAARVARGSGSGTVADPDPTDEFICRRELRNEAPAVVRRSGLSLAAARQRRSVDHAAGTDRGRTRRLALRRLDARRLDPAVSLNIPGRCSRQRRGVLPHRCTPSRLSSTREPGRSRFQVRGAGPSPLHGAVGVVGAATRRA